MNIDTDRMEVAASYRELFRSRAGRIVLADILKAGGVFAQTGPMSDVEARYHSGRRDLALEICQLAKLDIQEDDTIEAAVHSGPMPNSPLENE